MVRKEAESLLHAYREAYSEYAQAYADYTKTDLMRHVVLAHLMREAEARGVSSVAAQEREARASEEYLEFVEKFARVAGTLEMARGKRDERRMAIELWRSVQARDRAEIETYRGEA